MQLNVPRSRFAFETYRGFLAVLLTVLLVPGDALALAPQDQNPSAGPIPTAAAPAAHPADTMLPPDQLDSLVAPIALYPDPLLSQVLVASTYPLEIMQLQQWMARNPNLKDKALADAVAKQPWDPSVQTMAALPDVVKRLADDIQWTTNLGNAFLAQQSDVMEAIQRMRKIAQDKGALKSNQQMTVENQVIENKSVIIVEPAQPDVVYVPSYNPTVVYGAPVYPYPPIYYPPYSAGAVVAASAISFGVGLAVGAAWGGWGYGAGWGHNDVNINVNNNFQRNSINNSGNRGSGNRWQHNPQHRGGTPYASQGVANRFGGGNRGGAGGVGGVGGAGRPGGVGGAGGIGGAGRPGGVGGAGGIGGADRPGGVGGAGGIGGADRPGGVGGAGGIGGAGRPGGAGGAGGIGGADRPGGAGGAGGAGRPGGVGGAGGAGAGAGADRVGNRSAQPRSSGASSFGGGGGGLSGGSARSSSSRGNSSMGRSGGGRAGGRAGGGGRRR